MKFKNTLYKNSIKILLAFAILFGGSIARGQDTYADTLNCSGGTPTYFVDLSDEADSLWLSDPTERGGGCCETDDNCVQFELTLAPDAVGIIFYVPDGCGASPSGSLFYQVDCGPLTSVGTPLCLDGAGPHVLTFCKPGNNENCYSIKSFGSPEDSDDITITDACFDSLWISGLEEETVSWTSIFPGEIGEYDYLLDCTDGCDTVIVEGEPGMFYPELIQYQVCGATIGACAVTPHCDTLNVSIVPSLAVEISPIDPSICYGEVGVELFAEPIGGDGDYAFLWSTGATSSSIMAGAAGIYYVELVDGMGCSIAYDTVEVTEYILPITADAGEDIVICAVPDPSVTLAGVLTGSSTGEWSGGEGTFSPDAETMNAVYTPSDAELLVGFAELYLETTDNGSCPGDIDTIVIFYPVFSTYIESEVLDVDCFGNATGAIDLDVIGGALPLIYDWDFGADTEDVTGLPVGDYTLTMTDDFGCVGVRYFEINEPPVLELASVTTPISCFGVLDGGVDLTISGGTSPYSYEWDTGEVTEDVVDLGAGDHAVVVTDANGCEIAAAFTFTEPSEVIAEYVVTPVNCFGNADGSINVEVSGGTPGYSYDWITGEVTEDITGLIAGTYGLTVTDENGCTEIIEVVVAEPEALVITGVTSDVLCFGDATGMIDVSVEGGIPVYNYAWDDGSVSEDLTGVIAGAYTLTVTDQNGCTLVEAFDISQPENLVMEITGEDILCFGDSTGTIDLAIAGGMGAYNYNWSNGATSEDIGM